MQRVEETPRLDPGVVQGGGQARNIIAEDVGEPVHGLGVRGDRLECYTVSGGQPLRVTSPNTPLLTDDPRQLAEVDVSKIVWSPEASQFFVASREGMLAVWPSGGIEWVDVVAPGFPVAAPRGRTWVWASERNTAQSEPGLWVGSSAEPPRRVFEAPASVVGWSPDGQALFFASDGLYVASAPDFTPMRISEALNPIGGIAWVLP